MTKDEALNYALQLISNLRTHSWTVADTQFVITAIKEALAQPEQEPVAHTTGHCENHKQKGGCQLHNLQCGWPDCDRKPITTQPEQEPVVWMYQDKTSHAVKFQRHMSDFVDHSRFYETPLYTTPPQRKPLTDEEIQTYRYMIDWTADWSYIKFAKAIEAAHGITGDNNG